jgi:hypothetical protein
MKAKLRQRSKRETQELFRRESLKDLVSYGVRKCKGEGGVQDDMRGHGKSD